MNEIHIAIVDDHTLFRKGLISLVESLGSQYRIVLEAGDGSEILERMPKQSEKPHIVLMDVDMKGMGGIETSLALKEMFPEIKILAITMHEQEEVLIKMIRAGANGFLSKDIEPVILERAIHDILTKGFYYTDYVSEKLIQVIQNQDQNDVNADSLKERERQFLELACSDLTYKEIADRMNLSPKTIDGYRNTLFEKFNVKSRVGLALYAIRQQIVSL